MDLASIVSDVQQNWPLYVALPFVAAGIGFVTKIVAIRMMFRPLKFIGIPPFIGWQGVIPSKAGIMAGIMCDTLTKRLITPQEVFGKLDPKRVVAEIEPPLVNAIEEITRDVLGSHKPGLWESLPAAVRKRLLARVKRDAPEAIESMMREMQTDIDSVFDLRDMMVTTLSRNKELLNRIIRQSGRGEFRFIRNSGFYFGFGIGCVQAVAWALTHNPWVMPLFGGFVGWFSDWMALKMVFRPLEPKRYFGLIKWQGLFFRRQQEVAAEYGALIAQEVLTASNLIEAALRGPLSDQLFSVVQRHVTAVIDEQAGIAQPLVVYAVGSNEYQEMKQEVAARLFDRLPAALKKVERYADDAMDLHNTLVSRIKQMTPAEFEGVLRPAFQQDEWKLITVGAVIGTLVGELQVHIMLG